jgi:hypothetical protein
MTWAPRLFARSCRLSIFSRPDLLRRVWKRVLPPLQEQRLHGFYQFEDFL